MKLLFYWRRLFASARASFSKPSARVLSAILLSKFLWQLSFFSRQPRQILGSFSDLWAAKWNFGQPPSLLTGWLFFCFWAGALPLFVSGQPNPWGPRLVRHPWVALELTLGIVVSPQHLRAAHRAHPWGCCSSPWLHNPQGNPRATPWGFG